jgi:hypothetical protein
MPTKMPDPKETPPRRRTKMPDPKETPSKKKDKNA